MFNRILAHIERRRADRRGAQSAASSSSTCKRQSPSTTSSAPTASTAPTTPRRRSHATSSSSPAHPKMPWDGKLAYEVQPSSTTRAEGAARARQFRRSLFREKRNKDWRTYAVFVEDDEEEDEDVEDLCWRGKSWNAPVRKGGKKKEKREERKEKGGLRRWSQIRFGNFGKH